MTKLLLLSPQINDLSQVVCFSDVWSYYLPRELTKLGIELVYDDLLPVGTRNAHLHYRDMKIDDDVDHALALGIRYFSYFPGHVYQTLARRIKGKVAQFYDGPIDSNPVWSVCCRGETSTSLRNWRIGWAADPELCRRDQDPKTLRILIDHPHYEGVDYTKEIAQQISRFVKSGIWKHRFDDVRVRMTIDGGFEDMDLDNIEVKPFVHDKFMSYTDACREYSKTDIFLPTHKESLGLVVLETAMAGALVLARKGFINSDALGTVRHVTYEKEIEWDEVLTALDPDASRTVALKNSWESAATNVMAFFNRT